MAMKLVHAPHITQVLSNSLVIGYTHKKKKMIYHGQLEIQIPHKILTSIGCLDRMEILICEKESREKT